MTATARLEALLARVQANRAKPRPQRDALQAATAAAPEPAHLEPIPSTSFDVSPIASPHDTLHGMPAPAAPLHAPHASAPPIPVEPVPADAHEEPLLAVEPVPADAHEEPLLAVEPTPFELPTPASVEAPAPVAARLQPEAISPPSEPIARLTALLPEPEPATFGGLLRRTLALRPR